MNWLNNIFENFFGDNSKFFLIGAWLTAVFMVFGQFWSLVGTALAFGFVYVAEKQIDGEWSTNDMCAVILGGLTSIIIGLMFFP